MGFWQKVIPKHALSDRIAFSFTNIGLIGMACFEVFIVLPVYYQPYTLMYNIHLLVGFFLAIQVFSNFYTMILTDSTIMSQLNLPSVLHSDWFYCPVCQLNSPPRSHHCPVCNTCVIKRDHHCVFAGNCVGFQNHRYFILMVYYLWIGCLYSMFFNHPFYNDVLGDISFGLFLKLTCPMLAWCFGFVNFYQLFILMVMSVHCMAMLLFTTLAGFQTYFISSGQTQFECRKKVCDYGVGFFENWKLVLGNRWYLTWFSVFIVSPLPGDGTNFQKNHIQMSSLSNNIKTL